MSISDSTSSQPSDERPRAESGGESGGESPQAADTLESETLESDAINAGTLAEAIAAVGLQIDTAAIERLDAYRAALWAWNEKLNLTRHTTLEKFVTRDLVDTLALSEQIPAGQRVLDVGAGGGVPGVPLAILRSDLKIILCESVTKKANALQAILAESGLKIPVYAARLETVLETERFDTLIARAVAPLWKFMFWLRPHAARYERLVLIKGPGWVEERGEARHRGYAKGFDLRKLAEYPTPRSTAISTVLSLTPSSKPSGPPPSAARFPTRRR
ncbi:16S rRNA (guanine(527)-N(7))-methyltransferase RsmG [Botrimarina hoheduenensis]|uniref:Ribosomal RNA small subunit methyltransferase G n=1 Tax=Botrimarina hoheduenensis TaxID=2528000 RepID=A0A5C5WBZ8_9BACT|nr:16S rRNA (guanine(527)-N(7))-methyltransferase RsmG [Botrimarina hoheduenensis]TWT47635.1 Ribosomal RNA small subunit methyltransferase G [Botrimarina hoheduenensis]